MMKTNRRRPPQRGGRGRGRQAAGSVPNPLRADPTRTGSLRRKLEAAVRQRYARIRRRVLDLVRKEDAFGLRGRAHEAGRLTVHGGAGSGNFGHKGRPGLIGGSGAGGKGGINSAAFKAWFEGSKVVDEEGNPLVVYHGTGASFDQFKEGTRNAWSDSLGIDTYFFSEGKATASTYAGQFEGGKVMETYVSIKNPLVIDTAGGEWPDAIAAASDKLQTYRTPEEKKFLDVKKEYYEKHEYALEYEPHTIPAADTKKLELAARAMDQHILDNKQLYREAKRKPYEYDGIIVKNVLDMTAAPVSEDIAEYHPFTTVYIAFKPTQIKLASGNRGTFDPNDPILTNEVVVNDGMWEAETDPQKVVEFQDWLEEVLGEDEEEVEDVWERYIEEGYQKGAGRAFDDTRAARRAAKETAAGGGPSEAFGWYQGTKEEFLRSAFNQPVSVERLRTLVSRTLTDLKGVDEAMSTRMLRVLADGLVTGAGADEIARNLADAVDGIGLKRALVIARSEIIRSHAEGQLDALEALGVEEVGVQLEWASAKDGRTCPRCRSLDGTVFSIAEARGKIPLHPSCRCAFIPHIPSLKELSRPRAVAPLHEVGILTGNVLVTHGGAGSGNFGHAGRPGLRGGSGAGGKGSGTGKLFHVTKKGVGDLIRAEGFKSGTREGLELGPGVYLAADAERFPAHLKKLGTGEVYETETIEVSLKPGVKLFSIDSDRPNAALEVYKGIYKDDYGTHYDRDNEQGKVFTERGLLNWPYLHALLKEKGYGGIRRTTREGDVGNTDMVVFDPADLTVNEAERWPPVTNTAGLDALVVGLTVSATFQALGGLDTLAARARGQAIAQHDRDLERLAWLVNNGLAEDVARTVEERLVVHGGKGSGNYGHRGRPGLVGGSGGGLLGTVRSFLGSLWGGARDESAINPRWQGKYEPKVVASTPTRYEEHFEAPTGTVRVVAETVKGLGWHVQFDVDDKHHQTGAAGATAVGLMRQVRGSVDRFIAEKAPQQFVFYASGHEASRVSLYNRIAQKLAEKHGYALKQTLLPKTGVQSYMLTKQALATANQQGDRDLASLQEIMQRLGTLLTNPELIQLATLTANQREDLLDVLATTDGEIVTHGGRGSGNYGHRGRPGLRGGSGKGGSFHVIKGPAPDKSQLKELRSQAKGELASHPAVAEAAGRSDPYVQKQALKAYTARAKEGYSHADAMRAAVATLPTPPPCCLHDPVPSRTHARVGVPADSVPPPPNEIPRLPNLNERQRQVETRFADAYLKDPDGMARQYREALAARKVGEHSNIFATDDVKALNPDWNPAGVATKADPKNLPEHVKNAMAENNTAVHQTANAIAKRAFLQHLDEVVSKYPEGDPRRSVLVLNGGVAGGKGSSLSGSAKEGDPHQGMLPDPKKVGAIWDAAGEQNATENWWIARETAKRGIRSTFTYVWAEPEKTWDADDRGVIRRAMRKGRMVDARLFADSYAEGAKNMHAFAQEHQGKEGVDFLFIDNRNKAQPKVIREFPKETLKWDAEAIYADAVESLKARKDDLSPALVRGGMAGRQIWGSPGKGRKVAANADLTLHGGAGSGNFGHKGRPGLVGGSGGGGGKGSGTGSGSRAELQALLGGSADWTKHLPVVYKWLSERSAPAGDVQVHGMPRSEPMREVEIDGVKWKWGTDNGPAAAITLINLLGDEKALPEKLWRANQEVIFTNQASKGDADFAQKYGMAGFQAAATAGDGKSIVVYGGAPISTPTFAHESGHNLAYNTWKTAAPPVVSDYGQAQLHEKPVSKYGATQPAEDFAEAVRAYVADRPRLAKSFPQKHAALEKMLEGQ